MSSSQDQSPGQMAGQGRQAGAQAAQTAGQSGRALARARARLSAAAIGVARAGTIALAALALWPLGASVEAGAAVRAAGPPALSSGRSEATGGASLESAASRAGSIGRKVAMSLIGLGFAIAAIVLVFRRDFKEAAGVFVVGLLAVLLATPAGVRLLHATVNTLFGSS